MSPQLHGWSVPRAICAFLLSACCCQAQGNTPAEVVYVGDRTVQEAVDAAPPHSVVFCNPNQQLTLSSPVTITKPLTLRGLNARLPDELGRTPLLRVRVPGVAIEDFELRGNVDTVSQDVRAPLLTITAGDFRIENGLMVDASKDGIMIDASADGAEESDLAGGVIRNIVGIRIARDVVSISGGSTPGHRVRHVLVENIRCYDSALRGAVEVSDGSDSITVRKVYAENSPYAIDVQDHGQPHQINSNVVVEDVHAVNCRHAIRTANRPHGHSNLTMRDITAEGCAEPLRISNTDNVILHNVRIIDHESEAPPVLVRNCDGVSIRDITVLNTSHDGAALLVEDCADMLIDGLTLRGDTDALSSAVTYRLTSAGTLSGLCIRSVRAPDTMDAGIILERKGEDAGDSTLTDYLITGNLARVLDRIDGENALVTGNLGQ